MRNGSEEVMEKMMIKGRVVLMKKEALDVKDFGASLLDRFHEFIGNNISFQLISSTNPHPSSSSSENKVKGKVGKAAYLKNWITTAQASVTPEDSEYDITFDWEEEVGIPGAFIVRNFHLYEFFLKTLTLDHVPGAGRIHFLCDSWVYPDDKYKTPRVFFTNQVYLPGKTPAPLKPYREEELAILRGDGTGELQEWDRVYDYACYNDLGDPDKDLDLARPILGESLQYPYPRRGRTGRPPTNTDPNSESKTPILKGLSMYVPRDERATGLKLANFLGNGLKSIFQFLVQDLSDLSSLIGNEFESFEEVLEIFDGGIKLPECSLVRRLHENIPLELLREVVRTDGKGLFKFPMPKLIQEDKSAWMIDEEFAREMLAGINPAIICRLQEFPQRSRLNPKVYGDQTSTIAAHHIQSRLDGLTIDEAIEANRLYTLNYHDVVMPYLRRINDNTITKTYATRTLLFLLDNGRLAPLAIELSLPHPDGDEFGAVSKVCVPAEHGVEATIWQLAKTYVAVNDASYHEIVSHWLQTHAVIEPFIIAANRQLSVMHPIHKLLKPHFRNTMNVNALGRDFLFLAGGSFEDIAFPEKYSMELGSMAYKDWSFPDQALPSDLIKRGMAVEDSSARHGIHLLIEDYPYAVDGLEIWHAIKAWVEDYTSFYYSSDDMVQEDTELQSWWKELREVGHGDKKDEPWWPKMHTKEELVETCTTIIWMASALHAAINFGQYTYSGYVPNRPLMSRRLIPKEGTPEYEEMKSEPEKWLLRTVPSRTRSLMWTGVMELLSTHSSEEVYLGESESVEWTKDAVVVEAFERFGKKLREIEERIVEMNSEGKWWNRVGKVMVPYTLLYPSSEAGMTGMGIPNSTSQ